jgi:HlyD family secretion protein
MLCPYVILGWLDFYGSAVVISPTVMQLPLMISKSKKPRAWLIGLVAIGLLGTGTTTALVLRHNAARPDITEQTIAVTTQNMALQIKANGVVQAVRKTNISPKDSGKITALYIDEGDQVKAGELIARMDSEQVQAQVSQFQAELARAKASLAEKLAGNRAEDIAKARADVKKNEAALVQAQSRSDLAKVRVDRRRVPVEEGAVSRDSLDEALTEQRNAQDNLDQARASLAVAQQELTRQLNGSRPEEIAQAEAEVNRATAQLQFYQSQLSETQVRAPFSGIITRRFAQEGDFVTPTTSASATDGATSTSIAELSSGLEIEAKVPEASIAKIKNGQKVEVTSDAYPNEKFEGRVRLIAPRAVDENNVTSFRVKVSLKTGQTRLKSGMNVKLVFVGDSIPDATVVPLAAIITQKDGQTGVIVPDEKHQAKFKPVTVGSTSGDKVQVVEGLKAGDRIFLSPPPGQKIEGVDTVVGF